MKDGNTYISGGIGPRHAGKRMRKPVKTFIFFVILGACILGFYLCGKWELGMWMKIGKALGSRANVMGDDK
jgi:hypothetical protein